MLKALLLSRAAKLAATCVCPVAGAGVVTMAVPPLRHAVHHITAPRQYALPKTRVRPVASPCPPGVPAVAVPAVIAAPQLVAPPAPGAPVQVAGLGPNLPGVSGPLVPVSPLSLTPTDLGPPITTVAAVPEARTWLQLVVGFGMVGGSTRLAQLKLRTPAAQASETRA